MVRFRAWQLQSKPTMWCLLAVVHTHVLVLRAATISAPQCRRWTLIQRSLRWFSPAPKRRLRLVRTSKRWLRRATWCVWQDLSIEHRLSQDRKPMPAPYPRAGKTGQFFGQLAQQLGCDQQDAQACHRSRCSSLEFGFVPEREGVSGRLGARG